MMLMMIGFILMMMMMMMIIIISPHCQIGLLDDPSPILERNLSSVFLLPANRSATSTECTLLHQSTIPLQCFIDTFPDNGIQCKGQGVWLCVTSLNTSSTSSSGPLAFASPSEPNQSGTGNTGSIRIINRLYKLVSILGHTCRHLAGIWQPLRTLYLWWLSS